MADNYVLFSQVVPRLTAAERAWAERTLGGGERGDELQHDEPDPARALHASGIRTRHVDPDDWPGFAWELTRPGNDLWLYSSESGNPVHAGEFVRALLARFRRRDCWTLTWAETCSRPRVGEFGGGGLFVTAGSVRAFSASDWLAGRRRAFAGSDPVRPELPPGLKPTIRRRR